MSAPTFTGIQAYFQGLIAGDSALNALAPGGAIIVDPFLDQESARSLITNALDTFGACFEIGFPYIADAESKLDGATQVDAVVEVYAAEDRKIAHTPNRAAFVNEVILACTAKPAAPGQKPARLMGPVESVRSEQGYILHMFKFKIPLNIKPSSSVASPQV